MRIRIFRAFASNNSGSYTLVGRFSSAESAAEVERLIREACTEHAAWHSEHEWEEDGEAPLDAFARAHGLHEDKPGRGDDWPHYGDSPEVLTVGHQVLLHVPYTVTMPRLFGELVYRHGGRVDVELDHSHDRLAVELGFYTVDLRWDATEAKERYDALERALAPLLPALTHPREHDNRPEVAPVFHDGFWGSRHLTAVFRDLIEGVRVVREAADEHRVSLRLRITECVDGVVDPLAPLRAHARPWGRSRVILWAIGPDRIRAMKAAREVTGVELDVARSLVDDLPKEILVDVEHAFAERAAETLRAAGCDAEAVLPGPKP
jgi:ribosomal protein L7/L12